MLFATFSGCAPGAPSRPSPDRPPNIILVFIDDMGFGDLGVTGNTRVATPNIDELAREGTLFTQFYVNSPICSPSRVAITTGMYPSRWGIHSYLEARARNSARGMADWLDPRAPTLARTLQEAGYATAHFGKWHMGGGRDVGDAPLIMEYGFGESLTSFEGLGDRYLWRDRLNEQSAELGRGEIRWTEKHQMMRHYVDRAIDFVGRHQSTPFYLNLWPNDVHDEHWPDPALAEKYAGIARNEYEQAFFAVLDEMDRQLGRLLTEIDRLGLSEETIVVLTGDNGPTDWPRYYRAGAEPPGSTAGLRGRKWSLYEGGIREPLIVRWPGHVPAGRVDEETVLAAMDLVPSLARLAGAPVPQHLPLDGEDLSRAILGEPAQRTEAIYWYYPNDIAPGNSDFVTPRLAIREGRWKLLAEEDGSGAELYDLQVDPRENVDLATRQPQLTDQLTNQLLNWWRTLPRDAGPPRGSAP
jgi:arylsulfatase A-like enzyme